MFRKLESLKQDLGDGVSAFAQRTQEFFLNPYTIQGWFDPSILLYPWQVHNIDSSCLYITIYAKLNQLRNCCEGLRTL